MDSFYGGRPGRDFTAKRFESAEALVADLTNLDSPVPLGGYAILDNGTICQLCQKTYGDDSAGYVSGDVSYKVVANLKGLTGDSAGIASVSATVDNTVGQPSVDVTASGPDTAKEFAFAFHNLKGQQGIQGIQGEKGNTGTIEVDPVVTTVGEDGNADVSNTSSDPTHGIFKFTLPRGKTGYYFTPNVTSAGEISWTNNGGLPNPSTVNIRGPQGIQGVSVQSIIEKEQTDDGIIYTITLSNGQTYDITAPRGPVGNTGATGETGPRGLSIKELRKLDKTSDGDQPYLVILDDDSSLETRIVAPIGPQGFGLKILGKYPSLEALEADVTNPDPGDAYGVTNNDTIIVYIWGRDNTNEYSWVNFGRIEGPKGDTGDSGIGIAHTELTEDYRLKVTYTNGTSETLSTSIRGPQGQVGPAPVIANVGTVELINAGDVPSAQVTVTQNSNNEYVFNFKFYNLVQDTWFPHS